MGLPTITETVTVQQSHRNKAIDQASLKHTDTDRDRSKDERELHAKIGMLGEILAKEAIESTDGLTFSEASDMKIDGEINGNSIEIKARKTWNYENPDLLVRKNFSLAADYYIQIDLYTSSGGDANSDLSNVTKGEIAGVISQNDVEKHGEPFMPNKKNDTVLVPRSNLMEFHSFRARVC